MKTFFFDTANIDFIKETWAKLSPYVSPKLVAGITTNPNAFFKINKLQLQEWFDHTTKLCQLVTEIRQDSEGVVYIQCPSSNMTPDEVLSYAKQVSTLSDGYTKIGLKIAPKSEILAINSELQKYVETNVTGLADCSTALKCITYGVDYISVIPGRMEEVEIDAKSQLTFINSANLGNTKIIAGSMRTLEQLKWTFQYGTVPTIGERVWPLLFENDELKSLIELNYDLEMNDIVFSPLVEEKGINLSISFFNQMDECGKQAYENFKNK
jgi:transaldolase